MPATPSQGSTAPHHHQHQQYPAPTTATGDSFVRVLLNVAALQGDVAVLLLERLPEFCDAQQQGQGGEQQPGGGDEAALPALILGQFRW